MKKYLKTIDEILNSLDTQQKETTENLRMLIKSATPKAKETVKRGSITYVLENRNFVRIRSYKSHVDLGFLNGTSLSSPILKTRGRGKNWRHVEIKPSGEVDGAEIVRLLKRSAELFKL